jgi:hypothetical protein
LEFSWLEKEEKGTARRGEKEEKRKLSPTLLSPFS